MPSGLRGSSSSRRFLCRSSGTHERFRYAAAAAWDDPQFIAVPAGIGIPAGTPGGFGEEAAAWQAWLDGAQPLVIPPHRHRQVALDLEEYVCAYPQLRLAAAGKAHFWDEARGLFADDLAHANFSEHTQCLALLSGVL